LRNSFRATVIDAFAPPLARPGNGICHDAKPLPSDASRWKDFEVSGRAIGSSSNGMMLYESRPSQSQTAQFDPKDAPYVQLQDKIVAHGILTKDRHIPQMGGHPADVGFRIQRAALRSRCRGLRQHPRDGGSPVDARIESLDRLCSRRNAPCSRHCPTGSKALLILGAVAALVHPVSRRWICDFSTDMGASLFTIWSALWDLFTAMGRPRERVRGTLATVALAEVSAAARVRRPTQRRPRRARRLRSRALGGLRRTREWSCLAVRLAPNVAFFFGRGTHRLVTRPRPTK